MLLLQRELEPSSPPPQTLIPRCSGPGGFSCPLRACDGGSSGSGLGLDLRLWVDVPGEASAYAFGRGGLDPEGGDYETGQSLHPVPLTLAEGRRSGGCLHK